MLMAEDADFAMRLKKSGKQNGKNMEPLKIKIDNNVKILSE
jgi:hypothetical protein